MQAYLINLPQAKERLSHSLSELSKANIPVQVIEAILGKDLEYPHPDYDDKAYIRRQGRRRIDAEVGCYLSHVKAIEAFLASDDEYGLILEDDVQIQPNLLAVINDAIDFGRFDMLRLSTVNSGRWTKTIKLSNGFSLGVALTREKGAGAYLINRKAAEIMVKKYIPMTMPYDIRFDIEWFDGLRTLGVTPLPVKQEGFETQIQSNVRSYYLPSKQRYWTVMPYRISWEITRAVFRGLSLIKLSLFKR